MVLQLLLRQVTQADLESLIGVSSESVAVDFKKLAYPEAPDNPDELENTKQGKSNKDHWKISLCEDISAFANSNGGLIVCGMREKNGVASEVSGLGVDINLEAQVKRLHQIAANWIYPPIPGLKIEDVMLDDSDKYAAIVIKVPRSFAAPHRVELNKRFVIRRGNEKVDMNVDELRNAFSLAIVIEERIRQFRKERLNAISHSRRFEGEIPVRMPEGLRVVIHSIPLTAFELNSVFDLVTPFQERHPDLWVAKEGFFASRAFNFHGVNIGINPAANRLTGYMQVYRNGITEYVNIQERYRVKNFVAIVSVEAIEDDALYGLEKSLYVQRNLGIAPPIIVMMSLVDTSPHLLDMGIERHTGEKILSGRLPSNPLLFPDIMLFGYEQSVEYILKPTFDTLANTGGLECSSSYDANGNWKRSN
jgi:hypothetical protein